MKYILFKHCNYLCPLSKISSTLDDSLKKGMTHFESTDGSFDPLLGIPGCITGEGYP